MHSNELSTSDLAHWIVLSRAPQPQLKLQSLAYYLNHPEFDLDQNAISLSGNDIKALFETNVSFLKKANLSEAQIDYLTSPPWKSIYNGIELAKQHNWHIITLNDPHYPPLLKEITDPPITLWINGNVHQLRQPQLAIVGSRKPSKEGLENAYQFAKHLSNHQLTITSGLARGIDAVSHRGALKSQYPQTIAVMGTGLDQIYPSSNTPLAQQIIDNQGAIVTEFMPGTKAHAHHFPRRNRIIAGLSLGTLIVEATLKSGSLITARLALGYNRDIFAIPSSIHNPLSKGCHQLLQQGAKLVENGDDIFTELSVKLPNAPQVDKKQIKDCTTSTNSLDKDQIFLLKCLDYQAIPIDQLVIRSGFDTTKVIALLSQLELHDWVERENGGYRRRTYR